MANEGSSDYFFVWFQFNFKGEGDFSIEHIQEYHFSDSPQEMNLIGDTTIDSLKFIKGGEIVLVTSIIRS